MTVQLDGDNSFALNNNNAGGGGSSHHEDLSRVVEISGDDELEDEQLESLAGDEEEDDELSVGTQNQRKLNQQEERRLLLERKEQKGVFWLRIAVYTMVIVTAIVVTTKFYSYAAQQQQQNFQQTFQSNARKLAETFLDGVERKVGAMGGLSTTITHYAKSHGLSFPNVTLTDWESLAVQTRIQADGIVVHWCPLITDEQRTGWEAYSQANKHWREEAFQMETTLKEWQDETMGLDPAPIPKLNFPIPQQIMNMMMNSGANVGGGGGMTMTPPPGIMPPGWTPALMGQIHNMDATNPPQIAPDGSGPYSVVWQTSPVPQMTMLTNMNQMTRPIVGDAMKAVLESAKHGNPTAVLSPAEKVYNPEEEDGSTTTTTNNNKAFELDRISVINQFLGLGQYRHDPSNFYQGDPYSLMTYPVFDTWGPFNRTVAGFLMMPMFWKLNFQKVLPENIHGIVAVMKNSLGQSFTYQIDGANVNFLGSMDCHETKYDDMMIYRNLAESMSVDVGPDTRTYDGVNLNQDYCQYSIYLYPCSEMEEQYITNEPMMYAIMVAGIFVFTLLVLLAFDCLVARRQAVVLNKAIQSSALVSELFPKQYKDRLYEEHADQLDSSHHNGPVTSSSRGWRRRLSNSSQQQHDNDGRPIRERYEASTVLFMDLSGFTRWSASRRPDDVFTLLETLYKAFDRIAVKRKVYKIETIGDCYVAVTGVPEFQADHAPRMARFAAAAQVKMGQLIANKLTGLLGQDTSELALRVGMASGPIVGGILRGDRGRFQLFGDTINTASRMESLGVPGRIHVNQAFADELFMRGFGHWLKERSDKIVAKGKGVMTTYWIDVDQIAKSITTKSSNDNSTTEDNSSYIGDTSYVFTNSSESLQFTNSSQSLHYIHRQSNNTADMMVVGGSRRKQALDDPTIQHLMMSGSLRILDDGDVEV